jgi:long-chain acyl-CoA synthetase
MGASLLKNVKYAEFVGEPKEGETAILRNPDVAKGELTQTMQFGCKTVLESFERNLKKNRHKNNFIGYRKKINKDELEKKFTWITYEEANELLTNFCLGLNVKNLCPVIDIEKEGPYRFLGIYSRNKKEWLLSFLGAMKDSITIVTIYETLGDLAVEYILEQTQLTTIVIELKALKKILELAKENKISKLKNLIVIEKEDDEETCKKLEELGLNIYSWEEIVESGKNEGQNIILNNAKADDICEINYTSGTTGHPKGVKVTHNNIVVGTDVGELIGLNATTKDLYISYLPYAHIMETLIITYAFNHGVPIGIYNGSASKLIEDIQILKPTCICAVPRIFQRIYDAIMQKVNSQPLIIRKIFQKAIQIKMKDYEETGIYKNILFDNLIFKEVRKSLGGRVRFMLVGSAPVDGYLLNFLRCSLSLEIMEGYGQTEDVAGVLLTNTCDPVPNHLGGPGWWTEVKLVDQPELGYTSKNIDKETGKSRPSGEICVRGAALFKGYFRDPEKTKEAIDEDGWLHSGDIGMIIPEHGNAIRIVDRVKNIFKLQQGEYISPEKVENIYETCKYIEQIFVYGNSLKNYLVCIVHPKENDIINYLKNKGINDVDINNCKDYFDNKDLKDEIIKEMDSHGRKFGLKGFELPKKIYLFKDKFSVENQIITPTMKIKRHIAKKIFENQINEMYEI